MRTEIRHQRGSRRRGSRTVERLTDGLPALERMPPFGKDARPKSSIRARRKALLRAIVAYSVIEIRP